MQFLTIGNGRQSITGIRDSPSIARSLGIPGHVPDSRIGNVVRQEQFLEPGDTHESIVSLKLEWDLEPFTLSVMGANMDNHSFFERNVLWECLPDGWCPGVPVGGLSPSGVKADFHVTEGPSERDIQTMEVRAVSSGDGDEFIDNVFDDRVIVWQTPNYPGWPRGASNWRDQFVGYYSVLRPRTLAVGVGVDF